MLDKLKYVLPCLLILSTARVATTVDWHWVMIGLVTFLFAYFSKGMRLKKRSH
jgi:hypothetical protein